MDIFFASDERFAKYLCVAMTSILKSSHKKDKFNFYILDGGISTQSKTMINKLNRIKKFHIEYISVNDDMFSNLPLCGNCVHIPRQTYYRYIIPKVKPELEKCFYLDCDIIVKGSLSEFWNIDLKNNYAAVVEELYLQSPKDAQRYGLKCSFNAGVLLINNKLWKEEFIMQKLFENTLYLSDNNLLRWNDQDVLNYTFGQRVLYVSPKYNLQQNAFYYGQHSCYSSEEMEFAKKQPIIIHYNGNRKPWQTSCRHDLKNEYFKYLKISPYKKEYWIPKYKKAMQNILSFRNTSDKRHKVITVLGVKIKLPRNREMCNAN